MSSSGRTPGSGSLGWTTQSSFIPKESKKIIVGQNSSMVDLKAKILQEKAKLLSKVQYQDSIQSGQNYQKRKDVFANSESMLIKMRQSNQKQETQNRGVEQRAQKDSDQIEKDRVEDVQGNIDNSKIQFKLAEKVKIYEQLIQDKQAHIKGKNHLVDYEQKRWDQSDLSKNIKASQSKEYDYLGEMSTINDVMARERKAWEAEAKREIDHVNAGGHLGQSIFGSVKDSATAMIGEALAPLVKQRWDNILTSKEKEHLPEVIRDKARQQELLAQARLKRDQDREARLQKIEEMKKRRKID